MRKFIMLGAVIGALVCGGFGVGATEARAEHGHGTWSHHGHSGHHGHGSYHHGSYYRGHGQHYGAYRHGYGYPGYGYSYSARPGLYIDVPYGPSVAIPFYGRTTVHRPGCCCSYCR
jgi:hypothetical protein